MMSEAYLIAASQGNISSLSGVSHIEQVRPIVHLLFEKSGAPARRVQEIHWHGGDEEYWFNPLGRSFGFMPDLATFHWPAIALLAHTMLQNMVRAIEAGNRDLVILAQETGEQAVALLLASPSAVGLYNLSPRACLGHKFAISSAPDGLLRAAGSALKKANQALADKEAAQNVLNPPTNEKDPSSKKAAEQETGEVQWIAAARRPDTASLKTAFPQARWLGPDQEVPPGDLFLLCALVSRLEAEKARQGLLLSEGPQKSGLVTLVERI